MVAKTIGTTNPCCEQLGTGSNSSTTSRSSFCGSSDGSTLVSITVRKEDPDAKAGIQLEQDSTGTVRVTNIATNGLFADTKLEIGDVVLSVNKKRLSEGEGPDVLLSVVHKYKTITIAIRKPPKKGAPLKTRKSKSKSMQENEKQDPTKDNNHSKIDTYYMGTARHNEDGSFQVEGNGMEEYDSYSDNDNDNDSHKQDIHVTTISVKKTCPVPEGSPRTSVTKRAKANRSDSTGLVLGVRRPRVRGKKQLFVKTILPGSIFRGTQLRTGDRILSINDMSFRRHVDAEYAVSVMEMARLVVTFVVEHSDEQNDCNGNGDDFDSSSGGAGSSEEFAVASSEFDDLKIETDFLIETYHPVTIVAPKDFKSQQAGLQFKRVRTTRPFINDGNSKSKSKQKEKRKSNPKTTWIYVDKIEKDSIFANTSLAVGDKILSIDNVDLRARPEQQLALKACCLSTESVTMVVLKDKKIFKEKGFCFDKSTTDLEWEV
eukprot:jgi/Psemu1/47529/gm1.47529_g